VENVSHIKYHISARDVESQSKSESLIEGDSDCEPYLFHLDFCVILLQSI